MREILFRGIRTDTGEWVYGSLLRYKDGASVIIEEKGAQQTRSYEVEPETVGQYTGLKDKNGVKIFEGDIVQYTFDDIGMQKAIIKYSEKMHTFLMVPLNDFQYAEMESGAIVGNVWDNPELLGQEG